MTETPAPSAPSGDSGPSDAAEGGGLEAQRAGRRAKVEALRARGVDPWPSRYDRTATAAELRSRFGALGPDETTGERVRVAGRILLVREFGKLAFATLRDVSGTVQLLCQAADGAELLDRFVELDIGDWVGAEGEVVTTRRGELSVRVAALDVLAKATRPLPDKWHGLGDVDTRFRQRYVDLIVNEDARRAFEIRHAVVSSFRAELAARGFVEVETPVLQPQRGGATARPFVTHLGALDLDLYLRVAPELYLKRLVVGGLERVFEIGRIFRNEGLSPRHNPEFTMAEIYQALADGPDMAVLTEDLLAAAAVAATGDSVVIWPDGTVVDLTPPYERLEVVAALEAATGERWHPSSPLADLRAQAERVGVDVDAAWGPGRVVMEAFEARIEPELTGPVFVTGYPAEISPLAKPRADDPHVAERFELFLHSRELANGYSELNDPVRQRAAFEAQAAFGAAGDHDAEAHPIDEDYLRALEYGLPPTGGLGIGVDRVAMAIAGVSTIRDIILFPTLRPEQT